MQILILHFLEDQAFQEGPIRSSRTRTRGNPLGELVFAPRGDGAVPHSFISSAPVELLCHPGGILSEEHFAEAPQSHFARY